MKIELGCLAYLAERMRALDGNWAVLDDGVAHSGVYLTVMCDDDVEFNGAVHGHVGFRLPGSEVIWDCASGLGESSHLATCDLIDRWAVTTGSAIIELLDQRGRFGRRYRPDDDLSFPGWHTVVGPALVMCSEAVPGEAVRVWFQANCVLRVVAAAVRPRLGNGPHGVKLVFGDMPDRVAEVQVDGEECEEASAALAELPPLPLTRAFFREYALLLFPSGARRRNG